MHPVGLRQRLVVPLAWVLLAYGGFHAYFTASTQRSEIFAEATLSTLRLANTVRRSTRQAMLQSRREDVHKMLQEISSQPGMEHVRILNKEGVIMFSSDAGEIHRVLDRNAEACYQCHDAEQPLTTLETSKRSRVYESSHGYRTLAAIEVIYNEPSCWNAECHAHTEQQKLLGVVDVGVSLKEADERVAGTTREAIVFGLVSTIAISALGVLMVHRLVIRPVQRLLQCTRKVAQGDLDCTIPDMRDDEIGDLARSFVKMTEDLRKARSELSDWAYKLEEQVERKTRDLRLAQAQITRSEKLSSVGLLAAGVAHELNNPLTGILTFAHILAKRQPEGSAEKEQLEVIANQAERCATIIRQLLDLSRERRPEKKRQDLHAILEQAVALMDAQPRFRDIRIQRDLDPALPHVLVDADQMQQVFLNLLVNAGEAMPDGGNLLIQTRAKASADSSNPAVGAASTGQLQIVFRDSGVGIPPKNLHRVFDPFFTTKEVGKGTGLGLAVTYGIVERHGGTIGVESSPGAGTTFTITLPACGPDDEAS